MMSWALITGGTKGIGEGIAEALARRNHNLILVARDKQNLESTKSRLENAYPIKIETLSIDLSDTKSANTLFEWCTQKNLPIKILALVAGMGGANDFHNLPLTELNRMIRVNFESVVEITSLFIPDLKKNAPSFILLVSSMAAFAPIPQKNIYSASKAALYFFSHSLSRLLHDDHINVSCLCPGPVFTKPEIELETKKQLGWLGNKMAIKPKVIGEYAIAKMFHGHLVIIPGILNRCVAALIKILPNRLLTRIFYHS